LLYFAGGYQRLEPVIKRVIPHSLVAHAGLQAADTIVTLAGRPVHSWAMVSQQLLLHLGEPALAVKVVDATGQVRLHHLDLQTWRIPKTPQAFFASLGWVADPAASHVHTVAGVSCGQAWQRAWQSLCFMVYFSAYTLKLLLCGDLPFGFLLGPLGLLVLMAQTLSHSVAIFLSFIANLSIVVALGNLLPIPGLDGAAMMFAIIEKVRGKPMSQAFEILLYRLAYIAFCLLLLQFVIHDLNRLLT